MFALSATALKKAIIIIIFCLFALVSWPARATPGRFCTFYTTEACVAPGRVWSKGAWAVPKPVCTTKVCTRTCLHTVGRTRQGPSLLGHLRELSCMWTCLRYITIEVCVPPWRVYNIGAWAAPGHVWTTGAFGASGLRGISCTWMCVDDKKPVLLLDLSTLQRPVILTKMSSHWGQSLAWTFL
jgi:hypothetical protein